jgi:hypothetical protein
MSGDRDRSSTPGKSKGPAFMAVRIWHFTPTENVESIKANGFRKGICGVGDVYFAVRGNANHDLDGRSLLEVTLDITQQELDRLEDVPGYHGDRADIVYEISPDFLNAHTTDIRVVPESEYLGH